MSCHDIFPTTSYTADVLWTTCIFRTKTYWKTYCTIGSCITIKYLVDMKKLHDNWIWQRHIKHEQMFPFVRFLLSKNKMPCLFNMSWGIGVKSMEINLFCLNHSISSLSRTQQFDSQHIHILSCEREYRETPLSTYLEHSFTYQIS